MNSLANLNSVVDEQQGESAAWPSHQSWDQPAPAMICTGSLSENRLHFQHSAPPRQEWDWSDSHMILAPHYVTEEDELETKPGALDSIGGPVLGLRHYNGGGMMSAGSSMMVPPSVGGSGGGSVVQTAAWPGLLNALPLRQPGGFESTAGSCLGSPQLMSIYGGGVGNAGGSNNHAGIGSSYYNFANQPQMLDIEQQRRLQDILKRGMYTGAGDLGSGRLDLNLGGRSYFSSEDMGARFHFPGMGKRFRPNSPSIHVPLCQAEGCKADLSIAKHYHRRHKVCEYHSKAATVVISGNTQRFCQQCSRFHALTEFDEGKRSCRKRLADHNRRRRKPQPPPAGTVGDSNVQGTSMSHENNGSNQQESQTKAGTTHAGRTQSDIQGVHHSKEDMSKMNKNSSSSPKEQHAAQLLAPMTLAPSVSLTLQNGGGRSETQDNQSNSLSVRSQDRSNEEDAGYMDERHSLTPYLLSGPSLSLSSSNVGNGRLRGVGGGDAISNSTNQQSPAQNSGASPAIDELSVPWFRAQHGGSISRGSHLQDDLGKSSGDDSSLLYQISHGRTSDPQNNSRGEYFNNHDRLVMENMHNLHPQVREMFAQDHHNASKMENWMLQGAVASEGQTVLSLLETSAGGGSRNKQTEGFHQQAAATTTATNLSEHRRRHIDEDHHSSEVKHPLEFLQQTHHSHQHLSSTAPSSDINHQASDAARSLHCMQVLRPLSDSLYTTADFMKDGFA